MSEKNQLSILLEELNKTVTLRGFEATIAMLQNSRKFNEGNKNIQFVVLSVCDHFSITIEVLTEGKAVKDDTIAYCRGLIIFYLRTYFEVEWPQLVIALKRDKSNLWRSLQLILGLKEKFPAHREWINHKKTLDQIISDYHNKQ